jgi:hypothetical protein
MHRLLRSLVALLVAINPGVYSIPLELDVDAHEIEARQSINPDAIVISNCSPSQELYLIVDLNDMVTLAQGGARASPLSLGAVRLNHSPQLPQYDRMREVFLDLHIKQPRNKYYQAIFGQIGSYGLSDQDILSEYYKLSVNLGL